MTDPLRLAEEIETFMRGANAPPWTACGDLILTERTPAGPESGGVVICEGFNRGFADMRMERDAILAVMNRLHLLAAALRLAEALCALEDHEEVEPNHEDWDKARSWRSTRNRLLNHWYATEAAYRAAREGR